MLLGGAGKGESPFLTAFLAAFSANPSTYDGLALKNCFNCVHPGIRYYQRRLFFVLYSHLCEDKPHEMAHGNTTFICFLKVNLTYLIYSIQN